MQALSSIFQKIAILEIVGHIFFIAPDAGGTLDEIAQWTLRWMLLHDLPTDTSIYTCKSIAEAERALEAPITAGEPPALIVIDQGSSPRQESIRFADKLRQCIPEAWIIELVTSKMPMGRKTNEAFWLKKPVVKGDWEDVLQHVFIQAGSPQWSNAEAHH